MTTPKGLTYAQAGVSIEAGDELVRRIGPIAKRTKVPGVLAGVGGFSALFDLKSRGYRNPVLVSSTDGVGTKLKIAFQTGIHDTIGIDLVAMGVNDILTQGAAPLFFLGLLCLRQARRRNRRSSGARHRRRLPPGRLCADRRRDRRASRRFSERRVRSRRLCRRRFGEKADYRSGGDRAGRCFDRHSVQRICTATAIRLARKVLLERGGLKLHRRMPELGRTLGEELLEPTRIYAKITKKLFGEFRIKGAAHITGGGITGNLPRVLPQGRHAVIERASWPVPPVFKLIQKIGAVAQAEMDATFNNGPRHDSRRRRKRTPTGLSARCNACGERCFVIGEIRQGCEGRDDSFVRKLWQGKFPSVC